MVIGILLHVSIHEAYMMPTLAYMGGSWQGAVSVLAEIVWLVRKTYTYRRAWNSLEKFLLYNVQTIANQPKHGKIL